MTDAWGLTAIQGYRQAVQDKQTAELHDVAMNTQKLQNASADLQLRQQTIQVENQQRMADVMKAAGLNGNTGKVPTPDEMVDRLYKISGFYMDSGQPEQARQMLTTADNIRHTSATIENAQRDDMIRTAGIGYNLLSKFKKDSADKSPEERESMWQNMNNMFEIVTGQKSRFAGQSHDKTDVDQLLSQMENLPAMLEERRKQAQLDKYQSDIEVNEKRKGLLTAQTNAAEARATSLKNAGVKPVKPSILSAVKDLATVDYGNALPEELRSLSLEVAEKAESLMKTENLSESVAVKKAYQEAKAAGTYSGLRVGKATLGSRSRPIPLTYLDDGTPDTSKLKDNMYYVPASGQYKGVPLWYTKKSGFQTADEVDEEEVP